MHPSMWSLVEGQRNPRLRLDGASPWLEPVLKWSLVRDPLVLMFVPQALQPGTIGIAGPYYRYKNTCWCTVLLDMIQWVVFYTSLCPGHYIIKFCTMFMTHYWVDTWVKRKPKRKPSEGSIGVVLERIAITGSLNVMNVPKYSTSKKVPCTFGGDTSWHPFGQTIHRCFGPLPRVYSGY